MKDIKAIVIGVSAGGLEALSSVLPALKKNVSPYVFVVQHLKRDTDNFLIEYFQKHCKLSVCFAKDKQPIQKNTIYIAPPNYHMLINTDFTIALDVSEFVNFSMPSIDVLFESACEFFGENLLGVILTGSNSDGSVGLQKIKDVGGYTIVQDPEEAKYPEMPLHAIKKVNPHSVYKLYEITAYLANINNEQHV